MNLPDGYILQNGKYRVTHAISQGGFGITYKGIWYTDVQGSLGKVTTEIPIAIKEYFFKDYCYRNKESNTVKVFSESGNNIFQKFKEKLIKEARILSDVHHPHIVNVLEVFEENGTAYIAMEYISGLSLKEMMERDGILSEKKMLKYIHQIGKALQFVHEKNILHLDIKPSNILIDHKDNARLIDFGVSKRYDVDQQETSTTLLTLSKGFASVEQYDNEGTQMFSPYPDIYSLGATMYNLLTGIIPTESILRATRPIKRPRELNPSITIKTENVILKAMEIVPEKRFSSIQKMMSVLDDPPKEIEQKEINRSKKDFSNNLEDETILLNYNNNYSEQTIVQKTEYVKKKSKKNFFAYFAVVILLLILISLVAYKFNRQEDNSNKLIAESLENQKQEVISDAPLINKEILTEEKLLDTISDLPDVEKNTSSFFEEKDDVVAKEVVDNSPVEATDTIAIEDELEKNSLETEYEKLVDSGKKLLSLGDYNKAHDTFMKAGDISLNNDLLRLIYEAEEKIKEAEIAERKLQYEERMPFGDLIIVRKKDTGRYGAIDADANEKIPCIYLFAETDKDNKAFARENNLFDIYDKKGEIVEKGVSVYN